LGQDETYGKGALTLGSLLDLYKHQEKRSFHGPRV